MIITELSEIEKIKNDVNELKKQGIRINCEYSIGYNDGVRDGYNIACEKIIEMLELKNNLELKEIEKNELKKTVSYEAEKIINPLDYAE